ncbi:MAG: L-serine ammonia-lyase, iron-sulfur-dependent subunit beta [Christensenellales bacterium]
MQNYSLFDIIGPRMVGPSSSHTAGAAKLGYMARKIARGDVKEAELTLYGSFATTGRGHGTDKALVAGVLGLAPDDARLRFSLLLAQEAGVAVTINFSEEEPDHPNTARIRLTGTDGRVTEVVGASIGGGNIRITEINGMAVEFSGEYPTLIVRHTDVPGVINDVTSILARERINVAFMRVFRQARRADACMVIETDTPVPERTRQLILDWCPETTEVFTI